MIDDKEKLSLNNNMTNNRHDTTDEKDNIDNNNVDTENINNNNSEKQGKKEPGNGSKKVSPVRSLDLPKYGAIRKSLSPEKFILDSPIADIPTPVNEDAETTEFWSKLRCGSLRTEEVAEREKQKQLRLKNRQSRQSKDYPGLAFGSAMFGSDTTMKFNIIKNELTNIMRSQLKRVDGEMNAFSSRVKEFDKHLEESEHFIRQATSALADVVSLQAEEDKSKNEDTENESNLSAFDQHVMFLETQLLNARMKASQSFQILEDCDQAQESLFSPVSTPSDPSRTAADTLSKSSSLDIANGNNAIGNPNGNTDTHLKPPPRHSIVSATKEMEENIANGNVTTRADVTNGNDLVSGSFGEREQAENLQNGNIQHASRDNLNSSYRTENSKNKSVNESKSFDNNNKNINSNVNCFNSKIIVSEDSANANLPL